LSFCRLLQKTAGFFRIGSSRFFYCGIERRPAAFVLRAAAPGCGKLGATGNSVSAISSVGESSVFSESTSLSVRLAVDAFSFSELISVS